MIKGDVSAMSLLERSFELSKNPRRNLDLLVSKIYHFLLIFFN